MKKYILSSILSSALLISAAQAMAALPSCQQYRDLAEVIMYARQNGAPRDEVMSKAVPDTVSIAIVNSAYQKPIANTKEGKHHAIVGHGEETFQACKNSRR